MLRPVASLAVAPAAPATPPLPSLSPATLSALPVAGTMPPPTTHPGTPPSRPASPPSVAPRGSVHGASEASGADEESESVSVCSIEGARSGREEKEKLVEGGEEEGEVDREANHGTHTSVKIGLMR